MVFEPPEYLGDDDTVRESISKELDWQNVQMKIYKMDGDVITTDAATILDDGGVIYSAGSHVECIPAHNVDRWKLHEEPMPEPSFAGF